MVHEGVHVRVQRVRTQARAHVARRTRARAHVRAQRHAQRRARQQPRVRPAAARLAARPEHHLRGTNFFLTPDVKGVCVLDMIHLHIHKLRVTLFVHDGLLNY